MEGVLKGYDQLLNLVLDETIEYARGTLQCVQHGRALPHTDQIVIMEVPVALGCCQAFADREA